MKLATMPHDRHAAASAALTSPERAVSPTHTQTARVGAGHHITYITIQREHHRYMTHGGHTGTPHTYSTHPGPAVTNRFERTDSYLPVPSACMPRTAPPTHARPARGPPARCPCPAWEGSFSDRLPRDACSHPLTAAVSVSLRGAIPTDATRKEIDEKERTRGAAPPTGLLASRSPPRALRWAAYDLRPVASTCPPCASVVFIVEICISLLLVSALTPQL